MPLGRLVLLLLLILAAAVVVVLVLRRGSAKRDEQRVEAAGIRGEAEGMAATMTGQQAFAQQAQERAEVARVEAEERAREAARLEAEATERRAAAESTRREYELAMRRADDVDPDVKESSFGDADSDATSDATSDADDRGDATSQAGLPPTRAERRQAREGGNGDAGTLTPAGPAGPAGPGAVAAGAAVAGGVSASTWGARGEDEASPESQRIASAADYRDEVPDGSRLEGHAAEPADPDSNPDPDTDHTADAGDVTAVYPAAAVGTADGMSDEHAPDADTRDPGDAETRQDVSDASRDAESPSGEWGGPRDDTTAGTDEGAADDDGAAADVAIVSDTDAYASTEPLLASDRETDTDTERAADGEPSGDDPSGEDPSAQGRSVVAASSDDDSSHDLSAGDHAPAEAGAAVVEPGDDEERASASDRATEPTQERFDTTPTRDWGADEGELLEETHDRGDRLAQERAELETQAVQPATGSAAGDGAASADVTEGDSAEGATASDQPDGTTASDQPDETDEATASDQPDETDETAQPDDSVEEAVGRRVSDFHELRDGGFGVGSAAPLEDGAQPLDHPVQAYRDTMTFRAPGDADYDSAEPDVWFYDESAAERNGFRRSGR